MQWILSGITAIKEDNQFVLCVLEGMIPEKTRGVIKLQN